MKSAHLLGRCEALEQAGDLEDVCHPRPLRTREIFAPNAFYGNDRILKIYAGLPLDYPLKIVVPHGITFNAGYSWDAERTAKLPAIFYYGKRRIAASTKTGKAILPGVPPFAYVTRLLEEKSAHSRSGTLFFPSHSSEWIHVKNDFSELADYLVGLAPALQPVTVCIYWQDYLLGHHRAFAQRGLPIVSAGHINDPDFLIRLGHLLAQYRFAAGNGLGSHMLYALLAGCGYFHVSGFDARLHPAAAHVATAAVPESDEMQRLEQIFRHAASPATDEQLACLEEYVGLENMQSPDSLRRTLLLAERLDRFGLAWRTDIPRMHFTVPRRYERMLLAFARRTRRWIRGFTAASAR